MAVDLPSLVRPDRAAVVTSEIQNGVVGPASAWPDLAAEARRAALPAIARLAAAARRRGVPVIHCTFERRADGRGANANAPLFAVARRAAVQQVAGTTEVEVVPEVGVSPGDLVSTRAHGLGPMAGTGLDPLLRNLGVSTVVVTGVSVNVAVTNLVMDAVNLGYQVVLPRDAVAGVPPEYADAVIDNTLRLLATVTTTGDLLALWGGGEGEGAGAGGRRSEEAAG